jgi:drug/metabolite transporter (DMT)-like permease
MGDLIVLGSGVVFGVQTIAQKKTFPLIAPTTLLFGQSLLAIPLVFLTSLEFEGLDQVPFHPRCPLGVLYQGVGVSGVCFSLWILLLRRYPAGRLATLSFLTPLFGVGLATSPRRAADHEAWSSADASWAWGSTWSPRIGSPGAVGDSPVANRAGPGILATGFVLATARFFEGGHDGP